jgi:hypothetical protein
MSGLRVFAASFPGGHEIVRDPEPGFAGRGLCRRDDRVSLPLGAPAVSG